MCLAQNWSSSNLPRSKYANTFPFLFRNKLYVRWKWLFSSAITMRVGILNEWNVWIITLQRVSFSLPTPTYQSYIFYPWMTVYTSSRARVWHKYLQCKTQLPWSAILHVTVRWFQQVFCGSLYFWWLKSEKLTMNVMHYPT